MAPTQLAKQLISGLTSNAVNRDHNTAKNLRHWPELNANTGLVEATSPTDTQAVTDGSTDRGSDDGMTRRQRSDSKTRPQEKASRNEARIESQRRRETPQRKVT